MPLAAAAVVVSFVLRAQLTLDPWPPSGAAQPGGAGSLGVDLHHLATVLALNVILVSPLWTLGVLVIRWVLHGGRFKVAAPLVVGVVLWIAAMAWVELDPGALIQWAVTGQG